MTASMANLEDVAATVRDIATSAREATYALATTDSDTRDYALRAAASSIRDHAEDIKQENAKDMAFGKEKGLNDAMLDRLALDDGRIEAMAVGLETVAALPDPLGRTLAAWDRPNGLHISRVSVPLGVIGIIYESRPNVTADAGGLCLKSGNAAVLRGGSESLHSSAKITECLQDGLKAAGLPETAIQLIPTRDRAAVGEMLKAVGLIDIIIPRGGPSLTERVMTESKVPTLAHLIGNCHVYIHEDAKPDMARQVTYNAKLRRPGICGAAESLLVDRSAAARLLPCIIEDLIEGGCTIRGDAGSRAIDARIEPATEADWSTEYLDKIISVKLVDGVDDAIAHINRFGSNHTEAIITENTQAADRFLHGIDSGIVLHNASTQFADGGEFGMGAEIGISTGKLHARGPVGAEQLTSYKYIVRGAGQTRP
ncbi:MAG: glutamate-5-semialdehyde dehydrogenase [Proteobacteria bacterium]|nr:glutamate-5-semialdehyde dehydrogenase [Pseudomonadota bacterium]